MYLVKAQTFVITGVQDLELQKPPNTVIVVNTELTVAFILKFQIPYDG